MPSSVLKKEQFNPPINVEPRARLGGGGFTHGKLTQRTLPWDLTLPLRHAAILEDRENLDIDHPLSWFLVPSPEAKMLSTFLQSRKQNIRTINARVFTRKVFVVHA